MGVEDVKRIGVVGAGTMGHGIAQIFATAGYQVTLISRRETTLRQALEGIKLNLMRFTKHKLIQEDDIKAILSSIETSTILEEAISNVDFVIEAVPEVMEVKKEVFQSLDSICPEHAILASNTSGLSITEIGSATRRPEKVVGTHFWNPPHIIPLVEVVKGASTSEETFQTTCDLMEKAGKVPAKVLKDIPGFIGNRIQHAMWREVFSLLDQGVATAEDIDRVVKLTFGARLPIIGPLETVDLNGVDLTLKVQSYLLKYIDRSTEPAEILKKTVKNGDFGIKTGKGFYTWTKAKGEEAVARRDDELIKLLKPYLLKRQRAQRPNSP